MWPFWLTMSKSMEVWLKLTIAKCPLEASNARCLVPGARAVGARNVVQVTTATVLDFRTAAGGEP